MQTQLTSNIKFITKTYGKKLNLNFSFKKIKELQLPIIEKQIKETIPTTKHICVMQQTHSNKTITIKNAPKHNISIHEADALVSNKKNIALCVFHADCAPVIAIDHKNKIIGIAHAGWRGAKNNILTNMINAMINLRACTKEIQVIIGPCIHQNYYEVDNEFFHAFVNEDRNNKIFFNSIKNNTKQLFNLPEFIKNNLKNLGITNINDSILNTYNNDNYFSYRESQHHNKLLGSNITIASISINE